MPTSHYILTPARTHPRHYEHTPSLTSNTSLTVKSIDDTGTFEGYASLFNREDLGHDVILPGAFRDTLANRAATQIKLLFQHDPGQPIGIWDEIREDTRGLFVRGRLMTEVARAREVLALMRAGAIDGLSIGFKMLKGRRDAKSGIRRLEKVELWEISIVTFPMLPGARVAAVKAQPFSALTPTPREFERWLMQDAGLTRTEARALISSGLKGFAATRDAGRQLTSDARLAEIISAAAHRINSSPTQSQHKSTNRSP
jgi:uncharacterized protein